MQVEKQLKQWLLSILEGTDCYLVRTKHRTNNQFVFFIDSDKGFSLGRSAELHRALRKEIEEAELFPEGNYSLELSSPGVDEPLTQARQFEKNLGRLLVVKTEDERISGRLKKFENNQMTLEYKENKKMKEQTFNINDIQSAVVQLEFK